MICNRIECNETGKKGLKIELFARPGGIPATGYLKEFIFCDAHFPDRDECRRMLESVWYQIEFGFTSSGIRAPRLELTQFTIVDYEEVEAWSHRKSDLPVKTIYTQ